MTLLNYAAQSGMGPDCNDILLRGSRIVSSNDLHPPDPPAALLDVRSVARLLGCSSRHVYRLADGGKMPPPVRLGALVRWPRQSVEAWIAGGCQPVRRAGR